MDELSYQDVSQQYLNNLVEYKGSIVYVTRVFEDKRVKIFFLDSRLTETVQFELGHFSVIKKRLGMVNVCDAVIFLSRIPVRKMGIGLNKGNIQTDLLPINYPQGKADTVYLIQSLTYEGILKTLTNTYPSFKQALNKVKKDKPATVAFDRQFAVDSDGAIYYKTQFVGSLPEGKTLTSEIVFHKDAQHLSILLENNHEKTIGHSCS